MQHRVSVPLPCFPSRPERRARSVVDYLIGKGFPRSQLTAAGEGESNPVASNETPDGRRQNRRVELEILD